MTKLNNNKKNKKNIYTHYFMLNISISSCSKHDSKRKKTSVLRTAKMFSSLSFLHAAVSLSFKF